MKKIMFNDRYGLTQAVLKGRKTMTRRILEVPINDFNSVRIALLSEENKEVNKMAIIRKYAKYQVGEEVAVAQAYKNINEHLSLMARCIINPYGSPTEHLGWNNKMFVAAGLMPHRIRITDIKVERLQDISDEDCLREGIVQDGEGVASYSFEEWIKRGFGDTVLPRRTYAATPRVAFAALIDKVSGKGTWESNPWCFAYSFELIK